MQLPARILADALAAPLARDPGTASGAAQHDQIFDACLLSSQLLTIEMLRRPVESTQYLAIRYTERLADAGIQCSVGSTGDSYDNALAETIIGLFKTEVIHRRGPWKSIDPVEYATLEWVDWFNHRRLLGPIGHIAPAELEQAYYDQLEESAMVA